MKNKPTIAFGPERNRPSWDWVGFDISRELSKYYNIIFFQNNSGELPQSDLAVFIKEKPDDRTWESARHRSIKLVYCPIDVYVDKAGVDCHAMFLRQCETVLVHCERLLPVFKPYCQKVEFVEHHNRFGLHEAASYRRNGYAVWIGGFQNLPRVIRWLRANPLGLEIKFVADRRSQMPNMLPIKDRHQIIEWSPRAQRDVMAGAKVAFDIKGLDFNEMHKPPAKAQKFIASGIPFATNPESYSAEYFMHRGFQLPSPKESKYWLSPNYWEKTKAVCEELKKRTALENVGLHYKQIIDNILGV